MGCCCLCVVVFYLCCCFFLEGGADLDPNNLTQMIFWKDQFGKKYEDNRRRERDIVLALQLSVCPHVCLSQTVSL